MPLKLLLLTHLAATLFMTGVVWFVQVVHYPLFGKVGETGFREFSAFHTRRATQVVVPPMLVELFTAGLLAWRPLPGIPAWQTWAGLLLAVVLWLSTGLLQLPRHRRLGAGYDAATHRFLVLSNWLRTVTWTVRALLVLWMAAEYRG